MVENLPANAGDEGSIPVRGQIPHARMLQQEKPACSTVSKMAIILILNWKSCGYYLLCNFSVPLFTSVSK